MHKIIFDNFEFDLTPYNISTVEENYWFSDQFFTKYSFPGTFLLKDDLLDIFGDLLDDNAKFVETTYNVTYVLGNQMESAIFEIESQIGEKVEFTFRFGFDELPNFDKKLAYLPLEVTIITDIYSHAKTIISQKWPAVNYNYPQIHTDKYDTSEDTWFLFGKKLNDYKNGDFTVNTYEELNFGNRNIIQPLPSLLHILTQGFLDAGFTLKGDILTDVITKQILIYTDLDYFDILGNTQNYKLLRSEYDSLEPTNSEIAYYSDSIELQPNSTYKITGTATCYSKRNPNSSYNSPYQFSFSNSNIFYKGTDLGSVGNVEAPSKTVEIDIEFDTDADTDSLTQILEFSGGGYAEFIQANDIIFDLQIKRIIENSPDEIHVKNELDLTKVVPDVTFGFFFSEWRKFFNWEVIPVGKDIYINFLQTQINYNNALYLSEHEVLKPKKKFKSNVSFLMKFDNIEDRTGNYQSVFQNKDKVTNSEIDVNENTETITIKTLPLPQKTVSGIETANAFQHGGKDKIYAVLYDGLKNSLNTTVSSSPLSLPVIHQTHHKNWFNFRLSSVNYTWLFKMYLEETLKIKKKVFAYGRYQIVKTIDKTQISEDLFEVEIETETLP